MNYKRGEIVNVSDGRPGPSFRTLYVIEDSKVQESDGDEIVKVGPKMDGTDAEWKRVHAGGGAYFVAPMNVRPV